MCTGNVYHTLPFPCLHNERGGGRERREGEGEGEENSGSPTLRKNIALTVWAFVGALWILL